MHIVFLDAYTVNPGDLEWDSLSSLGTLTCHDRTDPGDVLARSADADVLIVNKTRLKREHFARLPKLRLVCVAATGYDKIDLAAANEHGIPVCNCAGYSTPSVTQSVLSLLLEAADGTGEYARQNAAGKWCESPDFCYTLRPRIELAGKQAAIVGFGNIGASAAAVLHALGMDIAAVTSKAPAALPGYVRKVTLEEAFATSSVVSLHCPLTAYNARMVNATLLAKAANGLIVVNTARGGLVDEEAVAAALRSGKLGAYCTDVLAAEPPSPDCPLLTAPRAYVTPHIAWNTPEARRRILAQLAENIAAYQAGKPRNVVNA